jgi:ABC-2 type transport system ATP-binding protein
MGATAVLSIARVHGRFIHSALDRWRRSRQPMDGTVNIARAALALPEIAPQLERPSLLQVSGLTRRFGDRPALEELSFEVFPGEIFGLLGPNGAGKSTVFQILASILRPDAGRICFQGRELSPDDPALRTQMGVVFQRNSLDEQLSARENLALGARLYALPRAQAKARIAEMLELIELSDRAEDRVKAWSGGMRRRLELARALVHQPPVLLMDEPTQGLDEASFRKFWAHVQALRHSRSLTVLLTTHRPEEAELCDRLAILDAGRLVALDSPRALASRMGGDVITIEAREPEQIARVLRDQFDLSGTLVEGRVQVERRDGHALIPRLVEAFPPGRLQSVSLRRPTLADVFLKLTGHALGSDPPAADPMGKGKAG